MATRDQATKELPKPWTIPGAPWNTEGKFLAWVRGVLRKGWSRHPIKLMYINARRERIPNTNPKSMKRFPETWGCRCEQCGEMFPQKEIEVDHIDAAGSLTLDDLGTFVERLYCVDFDSIRVVCKPCHKVKSLAERTGQTFEEAAATKQAIEFCKKGKEVVIAFLAKNGYTGASVSTATKRRALVEKLFKEGKNESA